MSKIKLSALSVAAAIFMSGCYSELIDSGQIGVELDQGKVNPEPLTEGWQLSFSPFTDLEVYNTKAKRLEMGADLNRREDNSEVIFDNSVTILTKDNLSIPVDVN